MGFSILKELEKFSDIKFDHASHSYTVNDIKFKSVTKLVGTTHLFDDKAMARRKSEETGIPEEVILAKWKRIGDYAKTKGAEMHSYIENLWLGRKYKFTTYDEFVEMFIELEVLKEQYDKFYSSAKKLMDLVKSELIVYDIEYRVAGTFDGLFYNKVNDCYDIWDWKTSGEIKKTGFRGEKMLGFSHLENCNFNEYALQLSLYKYIIEKNTDIRIKYLNVCQISTKNKMYNAFRVPYLKDEVIELLKRNL